MKVSKTLLREHRDYGYGVESTCWRPWVVVACVVLALGSVLGGAFGVAFYFDHAACMETGHQMEREVRWSKTPGVPCMVKVDGQWIDVDKVKDVRVRQ